MKNFDLKLLGMEELDSLELVETNGGIIWPAWVVFVAGALLGGLIYDVAKTAAIESTTALCERSSQDEYILWADVGHR